MRHETLQPAVALADLAAPALIDLSATAVEAELDRTYGKGKWFLYWDEVLRGRPIRGTISLAAGRDTLIIG